VSQAVATEVSVPEQESQPDAPPPVSNRTLLFWMFRFLRPVRGMAALSCAYLAIFIGAEVFTLQLTGSTINHIKNISLNDPSQAVDMGLRQWLFSFDIEDANKLRWLLTLLGIAVIGMTILRYMREVQNMRFSMSMVYYIREAVYDKIQRVGFGFHDAISSGQLINRALSDLNNVRTFIQSALLLTLEIVLVVSGYIILILKMSPWVALLALAPLPIWIIYILRFSKRVQPAAKAVLEAEDRAIQVITENIAGVHVVKAFATEQQEISKFRAAADSFQRRVLARVRLFANFQPIIRSIASASHLSLFFVAGSIIIISKSRGEVTMNVGDLTILGGAMGAILARLQQVATINEQYQNAIVSARRLYEVIDARPTVPEKPDAVQLPKNGLGEVEFDKVCFGYGEGKDVLRELSFKVPGGKIVAIVGPTGAGKSSMVNLVARFYDPRSGAIRIDGVDLRDLKLSDLRTKVSFVFQETYLFSDTVAANIAYGRPGITQGEIEAAARLAQAHDFITAMPQGYDTLLGERGTNLSGGQRQRLAIARAIVTNPRILILDDATAAIDPETEDLIRRGMRLTLFGRTTFLIAHRISTVKSADLVLVLEHGRITQMGTHDQLMQADGHYREIATAQLADDETPHPAEAPSHMDRVRDPKLVAAATTQAPREDQKELEETP
jgi:ABC-type multidrug transport system fused ATPase/permease subunit